jgi:riboflavin kinase / FMN adenylyltransferase
MYSVWTTSSLTTAKTPTLVALGNFDGVHRGHRQVIQPILQESLQESLTASDSPIPVSTRPVSTVVTFSPHPQEYFTGQRRTLLTPLAEKVTYLESCGVEQLVLLPFDAGLASLTPQEFVEKILVEQLQAQRISVGQNFRFGKNRAGTTADLQAIAAQYQIAVHIAPLYAAETGDRVSSSAIRHALEQGEPRQAKQLLGRPYTLLGEVVQGQQLGRTIGFPTANLRVPPEKFLPCNGVYRVGVRFEGEAGINLGVMNIGDRPTVEGKQLTLEVHLLDWAGDLYGKTLAVELESFLRPEQRFESLDALKAQIQRDCQMARQEFEAIAADRLGLQSES